MSQPQEKYESALRRLWKAFTPSKAMQWDMAAAAMQFDGYTDFEIRLELGPRPQEPTHG